MESNNTVDVSLESVSSNCRQMGDELFKEWQDNKNHKDAALALVAYKNFISIEKVKIAQKVLSSQVSDAGNKISGLIEDSIK